MSKETLEYLNANTLVGFTAKRGQAWHYREEMQGDEPNHYIGAIPVEDVRRRLFGWEPIEAVSAAIVMTDEGVQTIVDETRKQIVHPNTGAVLGVFKSGYQVHGYDEWLVRNVEIILDDDDLQIGSAGLLRGGAQGWVQIETEATQSVEGVLHRPFLTAATSMDGSIATTYGVGTQVVVCDNTLSVALGSFVNSVKVRHSSKSLGEATELAAILALEGNCAVPNTGWNEAEISYTTAPNDAAAAAAADTALTLCIDCPVLEECAQWAAIDRYTGLAAGSSWVRGQEYDPHHTIHNPRPKTDAA